MKNKRVSVGDIIKSFGLVFGDIGTSPIYTFTVIFLLTKPTEANIAGILSLIIWTLIIIVTAEYAWLAMSLSKKGEGGTIVLKEILVSLLKSGRKVSFVTLLAFIGISLLVGDGVLTPAISILSAVEGLLLIPGLEKMDQSLLILIAGMIAIMLFVVQRKGTGKVAGAFGPIMLVWFLILAAAGTFFILQTPFVLKALNPYYAVKFFMDNGLSGFFVLSQVILCATGGEALYADMGHLGRKPIIIAWGFVFFALLLNYCGQGAFLVTHPDAKNVLFEMIFRLTPAFYIPFLILSITATVIASQSMISGMYSVVYQGITTHIIPMFKVDYTSSELRSQIYIGAVNWFLLIAVLFVMFEFRESHHLAAAYGLAVNGDMILTGIMMTWIFMIRKNRLKMSVSIFITIVVCIFMGSNIFKIPHGGYWSIIIAMIPFIVIMIYTLGQKKLYRSLRPLDIKLFIERYKLARKTMNTIKGTALFFSRDTRKIPPYIIRTMLTNHIIYEDNILVSIIKRDDPYGVVGYFREDLAEGLRVFEIQMGYLEAPDIEDVLTEAGIDEKSIFYGLEDISTTNFVWKVFSVFKRLTPAFVQFYKLPSNKLHGVISRVDM
ncbi:MAG: KUP/HAK/KT family potassium transporter [Dissulfurispiraceae bacterium]|jgi:KUP system potassium uptake protein|nr:KUP/HAK/KT family potassium transporter [Dissulfurispiraceae bacterium]